MKKILLIAFVCAFGSFAFAQQKADLSSTSVKTEKKNNFDQWSSELNLSETQKQQIQTIQEKYKEQKVAIRQSGTAEDFKKLNAQQEAEIQAVLTPEQVQKAEAYKAKKIKEKEEKAAIKSAVR